MRRIALRLAAISALIAAHALFGGAGAAITFAADSGPVPVFTNKVRFRIPFRYDPAEMQRLQAREVQLYVSNDRGLRWRMADKAEPRADHFDFLAPADGEYWFAVRTLDAFNRLHPAGNNIEPALKVVVDATPPVLELLLTELEPGKVELRWMAADDHLDVSKLRIEYRQPDSLDWLPAAVVPQPSGQTSWEVRGGGVVAVRGSISDLAGNTVNAERELNVHPSARGKNGNGTDYRAPVAKAGEPVGADTPLREAAALTPPETPAGANPFDSTTEPARPKASSPPKALSGANGADGGLSSDHDFFVEDKNSSDGPTIQPKVRHDLVSDSPSTRPTIVQGAPATSAAAANSSQATPDASASAGGAKDEEPRTIVVNSTDFQIGYRIDDLGPSGLGKVELFITTDNGRKWYRYGASPNNKSPFPVSVPGDGTYGFELRVKNGAGVGDDPPRPGEKPSIVVMVDKTAPVAQLLPAQIGRGKSRNKVLLRWIAEDAHLGPTPILLEYALAKSGPWQKIGDWQANTGRYIWSIESGMPGQVYVRLTVKDRAGNVAQTTAPDPLVIDFTRPTAHIIDVEAKSASPAHD